MTDVRTGSVSDRIGRLAWEIMEFFDPVATARGSDTAGILLCSTHVATFARRALK